LFQSLSSPYDFIMHRQIMNADENSASCGMKVMLLTLQYHKLGQHHNLRLLCTAVQTSLHISVFSTYIGYIHLNWCQYKSSCDIAFRIIYNIIYMTFINRHCRLQCLQCGFIHFILGLFESPHSGIKYTSNTITPSRMPMSECLNEVRGSWI